MVLFNSEGFERMFMIKPNTAIGSHGFGRAPALLLGLLLCLLSLTLPAPLQAQTQSQETTIKRELEARFPGMKIDRVMKAGFLGLYEVQMGQEIVYTDERASYLINGEVIDARSRRNLTQDRIDKLSEVRFDSLPLELAIKQVRGNGKRQIAVFSDPNCPYCKQLDQGIAKLDDVTIYTFLYPILAKDSPDKARAIWCAPDRARTYNEWMLSGKRLPANTDCDVPLQRMLELGRNLGIKSVPVTVMSNGQRVVGSRIEEVQRLLAASR